MRINEALFVTALLVGCVEKSTTAPTRPTSAARVEYQLQLTLPVQYRYFHPNEDIVIVARVQPPAAVREMEFMSNGATIAELPTPPFRFTYRTTAEGPYSISARATLLSGQAIESTPVRIQVRSPQPEGELSDTSWKR